MTTSQPPLRVLRAQANAIAAKIKSAERGALPLKAGADQSETVTFGVVMDDKVIALKLTWTTIRATSEAGLTEYILKKMRATREAVH